MDLSNRREGAETGASLRMATADCLLLSSMSVEDVVTLFVSANVEANLAEEDAGDAAVCTTAAPGGHAEALATETPVTRCPPLSNQICVPRPAIPP